MEKTTAKHMSTAQMTVTALMTAITCILAPMALPIPISPVPISLTNLVIFFMAYILGMKLSVASYVLYLLLGTVGLPVFSGFSGGVGKLLGPTGGYLIGFIFLAAIVGFFVEKFPTKIYMHVIGMILGMAVCYAFGTAWLAGQLGMSFVAGLGVGVIPYLPGDTAKIIIAIIASAILGVISALYRDRWPDQVIRIFSIACIATPSFWLAVLFILLFSSTLHMLPASGALPPLTENPAGWLARMAMPGIALAVPLTGQMTRIIRTSMVEELDKDYVRTARGFGIPYGTVVARNVLRNALITPVTVLGLKFGYMIGGAVVLEVIFSLPGMGMAILSGVTSNYVMLVQGVVLVLVVLVKQSGLHVAEVLGHGLHAVGQGFHLDLQVLHGKAHVLQDVDDLCDDLALLRRLFVQVQAVGQTLQIGNLFRNRHGTTILSRAGS